MQTAAFQGQSLRRPPYGPENAVAMALRLAYGGSQPMIMRLRCYLAGSRAWHEAPMDAAIFISERPPCH